MLIVGFLFLVFAPCLVALMSSGFADNDFSGEVYIDKWQVGERGETAADALRSIFPEVAVSEDFEIRSFPKGISQRRLLIRDTVEGVKLTITQVRAAAIELMKLGGLAAAYEFALIAAAAAATMKSVRNAVAIAARETLESARNAAQWFSWVDEMTWHSPGGELAEETPPASQPALPYAGRWREATQAA